MQKLDKNKIMLGVAVIIILITGGLVYAAHNQSTSKLFSFLGGNSHADAVAKQAVAYLNKSVLQQGQVATLVSDSETDGVVKFTIKIGTSSYDSYVTTDGKLIFPEAFTVATSTAAPAAATSATPAAATITPTNVPKVANTNLTVFVVSSCPYGLQTQRALASAIQTSPALANYVTVRYIGAVSGNTLTSMHGIQEAQENLRQICIRQQQPTKYWNYVGCYMQTVAGTMANGMPYGDTADCQVKAGINSAELNACVSDPKQGLAYAQQDFDLDTKYNVTGSPTFVLNGTTIDETPFGGRSADSMKNIICDSLTTEPAFCKDSFDTDQATTSFSLTYAGATGTTTAAAAACAPAAS